MKPVEIQRGIRHNKKWHNITATINLSVRARIQRAYVENRRLIILGERLNNLKFVDDIITLT